jgi:hypothetical protein
MPDSFNKMNPGKGFLAAFGFQWYQSQQVQAALSERVALRDGEIHRRRARRPRVDDDAAHARRSRERADQLRRAFLARLRDSHHVPAFGGHRVLERALSVQVATHHVQLATAGEGIVQLVLLGRVFFIFVQVDVGDEVSAFVLNGVFLAPRQHRDALTARPFQVRRLQDAPRRFGGGGGGGALVPARASPPRVAPPHRLRLGLLRLAETVERASPQLRLDVLALALQLVTPREPLHQLRLDPGGGGAEHSELRLDLRRLERLDGAHQILARHPLEPRGGGRRGLASRALRVSRARVLRGGAEPSRRAREGNEKPGGSPGRASGARHGTT